MAEFLSAVEASPNGVLLIDPDERIQWLNGVAADHFGLDANRDPGHGVTTLVRAPVFGELLRSANDADPVTFRSPAGGALLQVLIRRYGEGMRLVLSQDITERDRIDAMRRDFVANVSHELRSPLTVLTGFLESLESLPLSEPERAHVVALMRQQADRMGCLVRDLLTLAELEGAGRPLADDWIPVEDLLGQLVAAATASDQEQHQFEWHEGPPAEIRGDESELFSALRNLLGNALRYTPQGGRVVLSWRIREDGSGEFCVSDSGPGIAREHLPRLTERFYRVDASRSRDTGGTGLGLAIAKHVAQRHGGGLEIESRLGAGSQFRIVVPARRVRRIDLPQPRAA